MIWRLFLFLSVVLLVLGGGCSYMVWRSKALWPWLGQRGSLALWLGIGFVALQVLTPLLLHGFPQLAGFFKPLLAFNYFLLGFVSTYFLFLLLSDLLLLLLGRFIPAPQAGFGIFLGVVLLSLASCLAGLWTALKPVPIRELQVPIVGLHPDLHGFRILQLSDLHFGPLRGQRWAKELESTIQDVDADLIAVTGDLVDGSTESLEGELQALKHLKARHGVLFVTGNHEYYSGADAWLEAIRRLGWKPLVNQHLTIGHGGCQMVVAGLPDPTGTSMLAGHRPDLGRALSGAPVGDLRILLAHQPRPPQKKDGFHLMLSGHTHGGQYFPWSPMVRLVFRYPLGLRKHEDLWIHTSPGTGFWGPPNRFLVPPEMTLLVLKPCASA